MENERKMSKVAFCENCGRWILACHIDYIDKATEKEFTSYSNEGFSIKLETAQQTRDRNMSDSYESCKNGTCQQTKHEFSIQNEPA